MTRPIYLSKSLNTASSNLLGSITSGASNTAVYTTTVLSSITLDTPRRIAFQSSVNISSAMTFTVTGTVEGGTTKTEQIYSSTGAAITTVDFLTLTSVSVSSTPNVPFTIGTVPIGGTRWVVTDQILGGPIMCALTFSSSSNSMTGTAEWTLDDPTGIFPISRTGQLYPQPTVYISSMVTAATGITNGIVNIDGQIATPAFAYRLTITSTSSGAGTVYATFLQQG